MSTVNDIKNSLNRLQNAFEGYYGDFPIWEDKRKVGMLTLDRQQKIIFVTYRGSMNSYFEIFSCLFIWKKYLGETEGSVHAGLYNAFEKTQISFQKALKNILEQNQALINEYSFVVEGYSRGSGLAILSALFLKGQYPNHSVQVFTYSTMKIFDEIGANNYNRILRGSHTSFLCKEDLFPQWIGPPCVGFHSIQKEITFHANDSEEYNRRVKENRYTYLGQIPIISSLIKTIISSARWEAHMPTIYNELAPVVYSYI